MSIVAVGSWAAHRRGYQDRAPSLDLDLVCTFREAQAFARTRGKVVHEYTLKGASKYVAHLKGGTVDVVEAELVWPGNTAEYLVKWVGDDPKTRRDDGVLFPHLDVLYAIKMSHRYLKNNPHFLKTMRDIQHYRRIGAVVAGPLAGDWMRDRERQTYHYGHPKLNQDKKSFFNDAVGYVWDHDTIHLAVKHLEKPAYEYFKRPRSQVFCDQGLFEKAEEAVRLYAVLEESYVLAIERSLVPHPGVLTPKKAFDKALEKVCTSITSGFFREYAWENYDLAQRLYKDDYFEKFKLGIVSGIVKKAA